MQELGDIIRDTGPVPKEESVETSVANSMAASAYNTDDEASNHAVTAAPDVADKGFKDEKVDDKEPEKGKTIKEEPSKSKPSNGEEVVKKEPSENGKEPSRPKHSIANLIGDIKTPSKADGAAAKKRDLEEKQSPLDQKKAKEDTSDKSPSKEQSDPPVFVSGSGSGRDNESAPQIPGGCTRNPGEEIVEEVVFFRGEGLGAECCTGNTVTANGNGNASEVKENGDRAEKDSSGSKSAKAKGVAAAKAKTKAGKSDGEENGSEEEEESQVPRKGKKRVPSEDDENAEEEKYDEKATKDEDSDKEIKKENDKDGSEQEEEDKVVSRRSKRKKEEQEEKPERGSDEEADSNSKVKRRKREKRRQKDNEEDEDDEKPLLRRSSGRIAALRIMEAERRQKDEEKALEDYKVGMGYITDEHHFFYRVIKLIN